MSVVTEPMMIALVAMHDTTTSNVHAVLHMARKDQRRTARRSVDGTTAARVPNPSPPGCALCRGLWLAKADT